MSALPTPNHRARVAEYSSTEVVGIHRPTEPVDLPESSEVEVEVRLVTPPSEEQRLNAIYTLLNARFESGGEVGLGGEEVPSKGV